MDEASEAERIGLLFVHGIGEQARWEHLKTCVAELADLLLQTGGNPRVTVVDRTGSWPHPAGQPDPAGLAPIELHFISADRRIAFACHEVWWADLGTRTGFWDAVAFWLWGLGQWCAPIYRELDASSLRKDRRDGDNKPTSKLATLPESVAGNLKAEPLARWQLVLAALAAAFVACTWSLAKRVFGKLFGQAPTPTLIVRYVGDVRTYEARAAPGDTALSDPGRPRRVGIRRRMVSEMIALATSECDGWYVIAHSLGTVVAYNGLTETGHALPNYLSQEQWQRVPEPFRRDSGCATRDDVWAMMPSRPPWLDKDDVIDRPLLFAKLRGFLTYGSPLDKFASLWPRIVATATDRKDGRNPFPAECPWINLVAPSDPVAGWLDSYGSAARDRLKGVIPRLRNVRTPWSWRYGLSHIRYFAGIERSARDAGSKQKREVAEWLLDPTASIKDHKQGWLAQLVTVKLAYPALVFLLLIVTTAMIVAAVEAVESFVGENAYAWSVFLAQVKAALMPVFTATLTLILLMGLVRWPRESWLNTRLAVADKARDKDTSADRVRYWDRIIRMLRAHTVVGYLLLLAVAVGLLLAILGIALDWTNALDCEALWRCRWDEFALNAASRQKWLAFLGSWRTLLAVVVVLVLVTLSQTLINKIVPPVGKAPG